MLQTRKSNEARPEADYHEADGVTQRLTTSAPAWPRQAPSAAGLPGAARTDGLVRLFGLLADPTRLRIVRLLLGGERNVGDMCAALGLPQPTVSHHLGLLRAGTALRSRRQGKSVYYGLDERVSADADGGFTITAADCRVRVGPAGSASSTR